jgi:phthiocerol/phenolphthiocerol synthesis type-I polyketide synthase E
MHDEQAYGRGAVAVVGMAGRFPGAAGIEAFWQQLRAGWSGIQPLDKEELRRRGVPAAQLEHPDYVARSARLDDIDLFDAAFFDYTPREAEITGPQLRLLLECAHQALEDAGCAPDKDGARVGTFVGISKCDYLNNLITHPRLFAALGAKTVEFGNDNTFAATQISYKLDLRGPAVSLATACSTSLVAIHLARKSLLAGECDLALAGGAQVSITHDRGYQYQDGGIHSPDGHCRTFDENARGTVSGNGVGIVALKRLDDARRDGDRIIAVLRGSAINNDGRDKVGYTAPSVSGQAVAIAEAQAEAGVDAREVGYVEAHGTATPLGDPVEIAALTEAFRLRSADTGYCAIGSLKSNLGHMGAAAGVGGFLKAALAVSRGAIPPSLHFTRPNPALQIEQSPFFVNATLRDWAAAPAQRIAGVSSFGMGGTNAHALLAGHAATPGSASPRGAQLFTVSAQSRAALAQQCRELAAAVEAQPDADLADIAYSLALGRRDRPWRRSIVADSAARLCGQLREDTPVQALETSPAPLIFLFPGQGAQHLGMAAGLRDSEPVFAAALQRCAAVIQHEAGIDLYAFIDPPEAQREALAAQLATTAVGQPVLFAVEYALAQLWLSWGLRPQLMLGHSLGEYVAATLAGVFTLEAALRLVVTRGRLMQSAPGGAMLSVNFSEAEAQAALGAGISLAAVNGPQLCVLSGTRAALDTLVARLTARGLECQWLDESHAFHSAQMDGVLDAFARAVEQAAPQPPRLAFVSNLSGRPVTADEAIDPQYWVRHLRGTVRFQPGLAWIAQQQPGQLLEVGPGQVLSTLARRSGLAGGDTTLSTLPHPRAAGAALPQLLRSLGQLWAQGRRVDWRALYTAESRRKLSLPGHPLERRRYWVEASSEASPAMLAAPAVAAAPLQQEIWRQSARRGDLAATAADWLLLLDEGGIGAALLQQLQAVQANVAAVQPAAQFEDLGGGRYGVRAGEEDDLLRVLAGMPGDHAQRLHLVDLRGLDGADDAERASELALAYAALAAPLSGLQRAGGTALFIASEGGCEVSGDESLGLRGAAALPFAQVAAQEIPGLAARQVDLAGCAQRGAAACAAELLAECLIDDGESLAAWRGRRRHLRQFDAAALPVAATSRLRARGCYLITGGLRGIGLALAQHLAKVYKARLVLVSRTPLPAADDWDARLAGDDALAQTLRALRAIQADGGEVLALAADVADAASMAYVHERIRAGFGALHGIVHAAGVADATPLQALGARELRRAAEAKLRGSEVLAREFAAEPLDFVLHCSSQHALKGGIGRYAYAFANAFLDADARRRSREAAYPVIALAWSTWAETGMAVAPSGGAPAVLDAARRAEALGNAEGCALFEQALGAGQPHLVVSKSDFNQVLAAFGEEQRQRLNLLVEGAGEQRSRPAGLSRDYVEVSNETERGVAAVWSELLGIAPIGAEDNFFELGGNSLLLAQVALRLRETFAVGIGIQDLFAALSVREQAGRVAALQGEGTDADRLDAMLAELETLSDEEISSMLNDS